MIKKQENAVDGSESSDGDLKDNNNDGDSDSNYYSAPSVENVSDEELVKARKKYAMNMSGNEFNCDEEEGTKVIGGDGGVHVQQNSDGGVNVQQNSGDGPDNYVQQNNGDLQQNSESSDEEETIAVDGKKRYEFNNDCADSSAYGTPVENEAGDIAKMKNFLIFDPKVKMSKRELVLGMRFANLAQLKECLIAYAVSNGYPIKFSKNNKHRLLATCAEGCPWRIIANPKWKLKDFVADVLEKYAINVSLSQYFRARKIALGGLRLHWFITILSYETMVLKLEGPTLEGLVPAIRKLLPQADHRCCARHIYANFRKQQNGAKFKSLFWRAAKSGTPEEFDDVIKEIKKLSKDAHKYLIEQKP
ncbi:hypothetical protein LguiA_016184 [Lonicera macranthoides]